MTLGKRLAWITGAGLTGSLLLASLYFILVSLAESPQHALDLFWEDRLIVLPILLGFGMQAALYITLKKQLFMPATNTDTGPSGALTSAGGASSGLAMVACCAHHVTDVLPILGLSAASTFLAEYRIPFMLVGLGTTVIGIGVMTSILIRERRRAVILTKLDTSSFIA